MILRYEFSKISYCKLSFLEELINVVVSYVRLKCYPYRSSYRHINCWFRPVCKNHPACLRLLFSQCLVLHSFLSPKLLLNHNQRNDELQKATRTIAGHFGSFGWANCRSQNKTTHCLFKKLLCYIELKVV